MPAQKRSHDALEDDPIQNNHENGHEQPEDDEESDRSPSSSNGDRDEYIMVKLAEIRKEVQCPICLGIIRKTRTVMECLHRFCRECIDKSMRLGNNECPACRTHCASRRSLRDDPNYDSLIAALYPDIDKYEEEELAFHEEEKARNKQIQASIAQTLRRQSEALGRKKTTAKATAAAFMRRSQGNYRNSHLRGRRNYRNAADNQGSDDNEDENGNDGGKDSSSADERTETRSKRCKRWGGARYSQPSATVGSDGGGDENDSEANKESLGMTMGLVGSSERLAWGKGGMRSHTRYGGSSGGNGKNARNSRLSKLMDYLRNSEENELDVHLMLVSIDEQRIPSLQRPYLCCRPTLSVRHLCQYVAHQTKLQDNEVEIYLLKELHAKFSPSTSMSVPIPKPSVLECKEKLRALNEQETLAELKAYSSTRGHLLLAYEKKWSSNWYC
ncbi:putative E3 ubiquitin-protein ligase RING1a isoform X1 [Ziziphus jujuba]|uniref:E3 ubiquitin-protein ligase RING1a isoform X1 n=1 Tax=Ziziphus jujuba TaxID=326968 RepID=A0A6P4AP81_ZIZJJ|nr:putative E3 ubiquitin-protein ligase RING1a isoform X1 [Ziziphus jujuba]